jgi:hypothetical protein
MSNRTLRIFFRGLCIFVRKNDGSVRVLLPDAGNGRSPYEKKVSAHQGGEKYLSHENPIFPHIPQLVFDKRYLKNSRIIPPVYPDNFHSSNLKFFYLDDDNNQNISWPLIGDIIEIRKNNASIPGSFVIEQLFKQHVVDLKDLHSEISVNHALLGEVIDPSLAAYIDINVGSLKIPETNPENEPDAALRAKLVKTSFDTGTDYELTNTVCWEIPIPESYNNTNDDFQLSIGNKGVTFDFQLLPNNDGSKTANIYISNMPPIRYMRLREGFDLFPDRDFELVYKVVHNDHLPPYPPKLPRRIPRPDEDHTWPPVACDVAQIAEQ